MPEGRSVQELRQHPRVDARIRCWCEGENVTFYARVGNLSEGGLFLRTSTPLDRGTRARVRLGSDAVEVETFATVVWSRNDGDHGPPGMGLRFDAPLDEPTLKLLRSIIQRESRARVSQTG
ncbi:MAG: TIGR02266 family protein [Myxococcaceae bacterium]